MEKTWGDSRLAVLGEDEAKKWILGASAVATLLFRVKHIDSMLRLPMLMYFYLISYYCVLFMQALRLFWLAAEMEHKAAALKAEVLQHLFVALAGSDCKELWTLLVHFFGKGTGFDPFDFLDSAPAIKAPLDLGETDSDEAEESDAASSVTLGSVSSTASVLPTPATTPVVPVDAAHASTASAPTQDPRSFPKAKQTRCDKVPSIDSAEPCIPTSLSDIHHTDIHPCWGCLQMVGKNNSMGHQPIHLSAQGLWSYTLRG